MRPGAGGDNVAAQAQSVIEGWPVVLSTIKGMIKQTKDAGFPSHVAAAMVLAQFGMPITPLRAEDIYLYDE